MRTNRPPTRMPRPLRRHPPPQKARFRRERLRRRTAPIATRIRAARNGSFTIRPLVCLASRTNRTGPLLRTSLRRRRATTFIFPARLRSVPTPGRKKRPSWITRKSVFGSGFIHQVPPRSTQDVEWHFRDRKDLGAIVGRTPRLRRTPGPAVPHWLFGVWK